MLWPAWSYMQRSILAGPGRARCARPQRACSSRSSSARVVGLLASSASAAASSARRSSASPLPLPPSAASAACWQSAVKLPLAFTVSCIKYSSRWEGQEKQTVGECMWRGGRR